VWKLGFCPMLCVARQRALATDLLGACKLELLKQLSIAQVSGIGGGNVLTSLMQKQRTDIFKALMGALEEVVRKLMVDEGARWASWPKEQTPWRMPRIGMVASRHGWCS